MSDTKFTITKVPRSATAHLERSAVLYRLTSGPPCLAQVPARVVKLQQLWRFRLIQLREAGWTPSAGPRAVAYARNCQPAFVQAAPCKRSCHRPLVCPFCYARWLSTVYQNLRLALRDLRAECGHLAEFQLVTRQHSFTRPLENQEQERNRELQIQFLLANSHERWPELIEQWQPQGAWLSTTVEPTRAGDRWLLTHRCLLLTAAGWQFPEPFATQTKSRIRYYPASQYRLRRSVASLGKYPAGLLYGDPELVALLLRTRRRDQSRLSATYGCFRGYV